MRQAKTATAASHRRSWTPSPVDQRALEKAVGGTNICAALQSSMRTVTQFYDLSLRPSGLRITQFSIMTSLYYVQGISVTGLARRLSLERVTLTCNLHLLVRAEYITVTQNPDKPRERQVRLTQKGQDALTNAIPYWNRAQHAVRETIGAQKWLDLRESLLSIAPAGRGPGKTKSL